MFISYAQNFEDVMLWRALKDVQNGFYVDIGAQDPVVDSVSRSFYERGWRGVSAEPTATYAKKLRENRPDEEILQVAIGKGGENIRFFEIPETGLSTGEAEIAEEHRQRGFKVIETEVPLLSLSALFDMVGDREIHWLKIDVEGMEKSVLESWLPSEKRPWVVVIESTHPMVEGAVFGDWESLLTSKGYKFVYFDGLNRFYVSDEHTELKRFFEVGPTVFDNFAISGDSSSSLAALLQERIQNANQRADDYAKRATEVEESFNTLNVLLNVLKTEKEELTQHNVVLMADVQALSRALSQAQTQVNERAHVANSINAELLRVYSSRSWKLTSPLRSMNAWINWFSSGTIAWSTLKSGSRPHRTIKRLLSAFFLYARTHPTLMINARRLLKYMPSMERRVRRMALASRTVDLQQVLEPSAEPEAVREIYDRLILARDHSANRHLS